MPLHRPLRRSPAKPSILTPVAHALFSLCACTAISLPGVAMAQESAAVAPHRFDIPAGPLDQALSRFGRQSGMQIVVDGSLTAGLRSPGLSGNHSAPQALNRLLAGTGLQAVRGTGNEYTLQRIPSSGISTLGAVVVTEPALSPSPAEEARTNYTVSRSTSATKLDLSIKETPQSMTIITQRQIEEQNLTSVQDILESTPGISVVQTGVPGAGETTFYSRGYEITNLMIDGMPTRSGAFGGGMSQLAGHDTAIYERVEIVRGSTGLSSGTGDPSASINFVRKRPGYTPQSSAKLSYGRWNKARAEVDLSRPFNEDGSLRGRLVAAYGQGDHWIDRVEDKSKLLYGVVEADLGSRSTLTLGGTWFEKRLDDAAKSGGVSGLNVDPMTAETVGTVDFGRSFNAATQWSYVDLNSRNVFIDLKHEFNDRWKVQASYQHTRGTNDQVYGQLTNYWSDYGVFGYGYGRSNNEHKLHNLDLTATGTFEWFGREAQVAFGVNGYKGDTLVRGYPGQLNLYGDVIFEDQWNNGVQPWPENVTHQSSLPRDVLGVQTFYTDVKDKQWGYFLTAKFEPIERLKFILGTRYSHYERASDAYLRGCGTQHAPGCTQWFFNRSYREAPNQKFIPYVGAIYDISPSTSMYASYTGTYNPQSQVGWKAGRGYYLLEPKEGNSFEAGIKSALYDNALNLHAAVFRMKQKKVATMYSDAVPAPVQGCTHPVNGGYCDLNYNNQGPLITGIDLSVAGRPTPKLMLNAGYTYLHVDLDGALPDHSSYFNYGESMDYARPRHTVNIGASYQLDEKLTLGGRWRFKSKSRMGTDRPGTYNGFADQGGYAVLDLMARHRISKNITAGLNIGNVFDKVYKMDYAGSYYGSPRSYTFSLNASF
ncbi:TonB-dependent siderophore receptor [Thauera sp. Sel9]|uniref:TonB-dependent siderophore receptor n=1 Tax=Thauera sp. Sel9 TaxID=2974299 RepID=UPI0021E138EE|nr:TonB-dependent receptor [Thauera sp. Sel9]MCV2217160.1 TonB-dependent receptor [Thauera sp. Sel9]